MVGWLLAFVIFTRTNATQYYLESHGSTTDMETHLKYCSLFMFDLEK